jgi:formylglycine-generating enzyme required for sulfatase activity
MGKGPDCVWKNHAHFGPNVLPSLDLTDWASPLKLQFVALKPSAPLGDGIPPLSSKAHGRPARKKVINVFQRMFCLICLMVCVSAGFAWADVFNMGTGLTSLETVTVGNPGNAADGVGFGAVDYEYRIGKYEVTAGQYTEFLNAVAANDAYGLYNTAMWTDAQGCKIQRSGSSGNYTYSVASDRADRPVNYVSWGDAARFANWLHNGQPTGGQGAGTTEEGAYTLSGATTTDALQAVSRNADWQWAIPSEDEWYKAAYHAGDGATANYWDFPTGTNHLPGNDLGNSDPGNSATYYDDGYTIGSPYFCTEVGEHEASASAYGTFDQGGNVREWHEGKPYNVARGLRGGCFDLIVGGMAADYGDFTYPDSESANVGFRVAQVPEPGVTAVLLLGGASLLRRRRRQG